MSGCSYYETISSNHTKDMPTSWHKWGAGNYGAGVKPKWACVSGRSTAEFSALFFIHEELTACCQNSFVKALSAPYPACTALPDRNTIYAVTIQNRGLWRVAGGILKSGKAALVSSPISNRDIAAGGYPIISGWGRIRSPFAHSKRGKPHIFPRKIGAMLVRVQICSRKIPGTGRAAPLCKVTFQIEP